MPRIDDNVQDHRADYKALMKQVERVVDQIDRGEESLGTIQELVVAILDRLRVELGLISGRLYERSEDEFVLMAAFPEDQAAVPESLPVTFGPVAEALEQRTVYMRLGDSGFGSGEREVFGGDEVAAIYFGDQKGHLLFFQVAPGHDREELLYSLSIIRHSINQHLRRQHVAGLMDQARQIQVSLLPRKMPTYGTFDISARSVPVELVGGDFFDFIPVSDKILGVAIADASGHGLPAALQVRDIYMGLRMGLSRDFKVVRTFERLNSIIHGSRLSSRFVSVVYGELEANGNFVYVNAGHPPPIHIKKGGRFHFLRRGGAVLGPLAEATYERGFVKLRPGDCCVMYTDGLVETRNAEEEEFGTHRILELLRSCVDCSAAEIEERVFQAVDAFGVGPVEDDRTIVVVKYPLP